MMSQPAARPVKRVSRVFPLASLGGMMQLSYGLLVFGILEVSVFIATVKYNNYSHDGPQERFLNPIFKKVQAPIHS